MVRCFLAFPTERRGSLNNLPKSIPGGCGGVQYRAAQLFGQGADIDFRLLFLVDVVLIQRHHNGNAQLQQLCGEEEGAAQIGGIHNVDDGIRILVSHIGAGDALFRGKWRHGVSAGQVNGNQFRFPGKGLFNQRLLLVHGHPRPVANLFIAAGQCVVHGGFPAVGIACKRNSHFGFLLFQWLFCQVFFMDRSG